LRLSKYRDDHFADFERFFARGSHADLARFRFMPFSFCQWRRPLRSTKRAPKPINSIDEHGGLNEDGT
jgi:hypothetical protein